MALIILGFVLVHTFGAGVLFELASGFSLTDWRRWALSAAWPLTVVFWAGTKSADLCKSWMKRRRKPLIPDPKAKEVIE